MRVIAKEQTVAVGTMLTEAELNSIRGGDKAFASMIGAGVGYIAWGLAFMGSNPMYQSVMIHGY